MTILGKLPLVLGAWCLLAATAAAQFSERPLLELPLKRHIPDVAVRWLSPLNLSLHMADLDGDQDLDLVAFPLGQDSLVMFENLGDLQFRDRGYRSPGDITPGIPLGGDAAVGDLDQDGDMDLVFAGAADQLLLNVSGQFARGLMSMPQHAGTSRAAVLGDLDGDGDLDLVLGVGGGDRNRLLLNDGTGQFADATASGMPVDTDSTFRAALGDLDGDGDLDLVFGNGSESAGPEQDRVYLNNGHGGFTDATSNLMPDLVAVTEALALGDVDRDGDLDLILGLVGQNRLFLNDGFGRMLDATGLRMPVDGDATRDLSLADVDGDGDPDLIAANDGPSRLYRNDGAGGFAIDSASSLVGAVESWQVAAGDLDGDGDLDVVLASAETLGDFGGITEIYVNDGSGGFQLITPHRFPQRRLLTGAMAMVDVDRDDDLDVVLGNQSAVDGPPQNLLYVNDGTGVFEDQTAQRMPVDMSDTRAVAAGDLDGDGDQDLLFGNGGASPQNRLYLNDGTGRFLDGTAFGLPVDSDETSAIALADVDRDGDLDAVLGNDGPSGEQNRLYLNVRRGGFVDATERLPAVLDKTTAVALGDVDGDGDPDLVVGNIGQSRLYINQGDGRFVDRTSSAMPEIELQTRALVLIDGDGDGDRDLLLGNWLYENDGAGSFSDVSASHLVGAFHPPLSTAVADVDLDGDPDLVLGHRREVNTVTVGVNDGAGHFVSQRFGIGTAIGATSLAVGDIDGDRDPDLVLGLTQFGIVGGPVAARNRLLTNLHVQISTPFVPRSSEAFTIEFRATRFEFEGSSTGFTAIPALSLSLAPEPLGLGALGALYLDPLGMFPVPETRVPTGFRGSVSIQIPPFAALLGRTVYAQALIIRDSDPLDARLTGYTADLILR